MPEDTQVFIPLASLRLKPAPQADSHVLDCRACPLIPGGSCRETPLPCVSQAPQVILLGLPSCTPGRPVCASPRGTRENIRRESGVFSQSPGYDRGSKTPSVAKIPQVPVWPDRYPGCGKDTAGVWLGDHRVPSACGKKTAVAVVFVPQGLVYKLRVQKRHR